MGTCYSLKARGADPYTVCPSEMPQSEPTIQGSPSTSTGSGGGGLRKPYGGRYAQYQNRNSNEQPGEDSERAALSTISDNSPLMMPQTSTKTEPTSADKPKKTRFGFKVPTSIKKPDTNSNLMTTSTESAVSVSSSNSGSGKEANLDRKGSKRPKSGAFDVEGADKWLMIDDSRSNSRASSLKSKKSASSKERQLAELSDDVSNGNRQPATSAAGQSTNGKSLDKDKATSAGAASKTSGGSRLPSKLRGPFTRFFGAKKDASAANGAEDNKWVKATAASDQTEPSTSDSTSRSSKKVGNNGKKSESSSKKSESNGKKQELNGRKPEQKSGRGAVNFLRSIGKPKSSASTSQNSADKGKTNPSSKGQGQQSKDNRQFKSGGAMAEAPKTPLVKAPIAVIDSAETTSIGSIHSDDLMLDIDVNLEEYDEESHLHGQSSRSLEKGFARADSRSRTKSQDSVDLQRDVFKPVDAPTMAAAAATAVRYDNRKPLLNRRHISESGLPRRHNSGGSQKMAAYRRNQNEPLQELATLIHDNPAVRRRPPKLSKISRPASFPCPTRKGSAVSAAAAHNATLEVDHSEEKPLSLPAVVKPLKPPRQTPSIGDDEQMTVDISTHRHMMQDVTNLKTMLFKLRRVIQEDEFGSWKNGLRLSGSQPNSPMKEDLTLLSFLEESEETPSAEKLLQENQELKQQLQVLQKQLEEQEVTVKLLQQQMTKYEYGGEVGAGDRVSMNTVTTQTDKQLQQQPSAAKSTSTKSSRNTTAVPRYRTEVSSGLHQANESPRKKPSSPLSSVSLPLVSTGCIGIASAVSADNVFERDENGAVEQETRSANISGQRSPLLSTQELAKSEPGPPAVNSAPCLNGTFTLEEEISVTVISSSNETVTTDTSDYVSDLVTEPSVTSATERSTTSTDTGLSVSRGTEAKPRGIPKVSSAGSSKLNNLNHIPKAAPKSGIPSTRSNPSSLVKPATGHNKQLPKVQSQLRQPGQIGQSGAGRGRGTYQSRLPALGIKKIARSNPQLHSYAEQKTVSG